MTTLPRASRRRPPARQLLLSAAARVFARDGLEGATTRAISREAGVNEVTLFRHFGTKEHLLEAVVGKAFGGSPGRATEKPQRPEGSLKSDLESFAERYESLLMENLQLIRALIGEIHRHALCQDQALQGIFLPLREALTERIGRAIRSGEVRAGTNPAIAADLFAGTIFAAVLRRATLKRAQGYSSAEYRKASVEVFVRGIAP